MRGIIKLSCNDQSNKISWLTFCHTWSTSEYGNPWLWPWKAGSRNIALRVLQGKAYPLWHLFCQKVHHHVLFIFLLAHVVHTMVQCNASRPSNKSSLSLNWNTPSPFSTKSHFIGSQNCSRAGVLVLQLWGRLMFRRLWVRIPVPDTGWTFIHI